MNNKLAYVSLLAFVLPLSACVGVEGELADSEELTADELAEVDELTAEDAAALTGTRQWRNTSTLFCLDSNSNGSVYALGCNGGGYQRWSHSRYPYGDQIRNYQTNRCLDSNTQGQVYTGSCNGGKFQQWQVTYTGAYGYQIKNFATDLCLDSNTAGNVYTHSCNGGNFQRWN